jgi:hypothetical protein
MPVRNHIDPFDRRDPLDILEALRATRSTGVMLLAMRLEVECGQLRSAASIAEKAAPYVHPKMAPRAEEGGDKELTIKIIGGLPE